MPELPEVETVVTGLRKSIVGKEIMNITELRPDTVHSHLDQDRICFGKIISVNRRGKYILIETDAELMIIVHLRMTGKLVLDVSEQEEYRHIRARIEFKDGEILHFDDTRTFGNIDIYRLEDYASALKNLGPEPLSKSFDEKYFKSILEHRKAPIKNILLDQAVVAGLGNIYVSEILFRAGVDPRTSGKDLSLKETSLVVEHTRNVISEAIAARGTTISDYQDVSGSSGRFQNSLRIYGKKKCRCGAEIRKVKLAGRSSYYCPCCQK